VIEYANNKTEPTNELLYVDLCAFLDYKEKCSPENFNKEEAFTKCWELVERTKVRTGDDGAFKDWSAIRSYYPAGSHSIEWCDFTKFAFHVDRFKTYLERIPLGLNEYKKIIDRLKPTHVEITGGEPTLVPFLDDLCNYLEEKGIVYLVKSNGFKRCKNQVTAWHDPIDKPPENFDQIVIVQKIEGWKEKAAYCEEHNIPYNVIGFKLDNINSPVFDNSQVCLMFLCNNGELKRCHSMPSFYDNIIFENRNLYWQTCNCWQCKELNDFIIFLPEEEKNKFWDTLQNPKEDIAKTDPLVYS